MPDISSIDAVLNFKNHNYLYFVANPDKPGYHSFQELWKRSQLLQKSLYQLVKKKVIILFSTNQKYSWLFVKIYFSSSIGELVNLKFFSLFESKDEAIESFVFGESTFKIKASN